MHPLAGALRVALLVPLAGAFLSPTVLAETPAPGYAVTTAPNPVFGATTTTLASGELVTWDGLTVDRWTADGTFLGTLTSFGSSVFPSFVVESPDGTEVVVGESSFGRIYRVPLDGSGRTFLRKLAFNFDAEFAPDGTLIVSAATCGFGCGNDLLCLSLDGAVVRLAKVAGPSGPVAVDAGGDLYYATLGSPATPGSTDVLRWTAAQLAGGDLLDESDAAVVGTGYDPAGALELDPVTGALYLATNDFGSGAASIVQVAGDAFDAPTVVVPDQFVFGMQLLDLGGPASFDPYQPASGQVLRYGRTTGVASDLVTVSPARPQLTVSGAGTTGVGEVVFDVTGADPGGGFTLVWAPQASFDPVESVFDFPTFRFHTGLALGELIRLNLPIAVDGAGNGQLSVFNAGTLAGQFAWQVIVRDPTGRAIGSSNSVLF